jgi:hypothetical protein
MPATIGTSLFLPGLSLKVTAIAPTRFSPLLTQLPLSFESFPVLEKGPTLRFQSRCSGNSCCTSRRRPETQE